MHKFILILFTCISFVFSSEIAIVKNAVGNVFVKKQDVITKVEVGHKLTVGDILLTKEKSSIGLIFHDGTILSLGENSVLKINQYLFEPTKAVYDLDLDMKKGLASFESGKIGKLAPESVKFRVPEGIVGIRGTKFYVEVK